MYFFKNRLCLNEIMNMHDNINKYTITTDLSSEVLEIEKFKSERLSELVPINFK